MANYLLRPLYFQIFGSEFCSDNYEDQQKMQNSMYLLQEMGIFVGDYNFFWLKKGVYSIALRNDIINLSGTDEMDVNFSQDAKDSVELLRKVFFKSGVNYPLVRWIECLASMLHLKSYILPVSSSDETILEELQKRKPYFCNKEDNLAALNSLKELSL